MRRRTFLAGAAAGLGLGAAGGLWAVQPRRDWLVAPGSRLPERVNGRPRVVVIGGGLAGLSAATELAVRGCEVTLLERAPGLGGKVGGWDVRALGETFPLEHGFHGFFSQYYNLNELMSAAGVAPTDLEPQPSYPVAFPSGPPETFRNTTPIWPFNLASVIAGSERLHPADFREADGLLELMRFRGEATFTAFDDVDFASWIAARRIPRSMVDVVLRPFGDTTLNRIERLSAAEAIRFFHFYFLGNPEGLAFRSLRRPSPVSVLEPLARRLVAAGATIRTSTPARRLLRDGDRVVGVELGDAGPTGELVLPGAEVGEGLRALELGGLPVAVGRRAGQAVAFDRRCSHQGCPVEVVADGFRCPCHGGRFDLEGRPTAGPPRAPLARLRVGEVDGVVTVRAPETSPEVLPCDFCVVACDVRGLRAVVGASELEAEFSARVAAVGESEPYAVVRWWFDAPVAPERSPFSTTTGFRYTDSIAIYSAFQEPFVGWAASTGGSVIESHAYAIAPEDLAPVDVLVERLLEELRATWPELGTARVLHVEAQLQSNFSRWAPGDHAGRPVTETPHPNLFLAGDHVRVDAPVALMEAAVTSGRLAANGVLAALGTAPVPIPIVSRTGVLSRG